MSESEYALLVVGCFVFVVLAALASTGRARRRRAEAFASHASLYEVDVERLNEWSWRFVVKVAGREIELRDGYRGGGGSDSHSIAAHELTLATELRGRSWDLHSVDIMRRRTTSEDFENAFVLRDLGLPLREGWLTPAVRSAISSSFAPAHHLSKISIEAGQLVYLLSASPGQVSTAALESLLAALNELATRMESARGTREASTTN